MGNVENLTPFKKGHKKLGGRKKGGRNIFPRVLAEAVLVAAETYGVDGKGTGGLVGFCKTMWDEYPKQFLRLVARVMLLQEKRPPDKPSRYACNLDLLADEEKTELKRLLCKAKIHLRIVTDEDGTTSYEPLDPDYVETLKATFEAQKWRPPVASVSSFQRMIEKMVRTREARICGVHSRCRNAS